MVDDARGHEQSRLERGMVEDVKDRRHGTERRARSQQHGNQAQMADGGKGKQGLEIMFEQRNHRAQDHRHQTRRCYDDKPFGGPRQNRPHPCHQENTRFHHRGRVQVGRHRCWCCHRVRQPEMKRELGGFRKTPYQDQDQGRQIQRVRLNKLAVLQNDAQVITAHDLTQNQHAADHCQPAHASDGQRHTRTLTTSRKVLPIPDQQEG